MSQVLSASGQRAALAGRVVAVLVPVLMAAALTWPLLTEEGHPLARDLVFLPRHAFFPGILDGAGASPRAVPLDFVMAVLTSALDGGVWARLLVPGFLVLGGWGVQALVLRFDPDAPALALMVAGGFGVWNPWTVERLALGQWALLAAWAGMGWLVLSVHRWRAQPGPGQFAAVLACVLVASLTPTGGLIAFACVAVLAIGRGRASLALVLCAAAAQLPWVLAGFTSGSGLTSDPGGVGAFAARADGADTVWLTLAGLGGIWDAGATPPTRELQAWSLGAGLLTLAVLAFALLRRTPDRSWRRRVIGCVVLGYALAVASSTGIGHDLVVWLVANAPGGGLARDSQKFLLGWALAFCWASGALVARVSRQVGDWAPALWPVALLPLALLPDATAVTWPTVRPVQLANGYAQVEAALRDAGAVGDECHMVSLPLRAYRNFEWGSGLTSSDPATRWFDCSVVADDRLVVGDVEIRGENPTVAEMARRTQAGEDWASVLGSLGIDWVLVDRGDPAADELDLAGFDVVHEDPDLLLLRRPTPRPIQGAVAQDAN